MHLADSFGREQHNQVDERGTPLNQTGGFHSLAALLFISPLLWSELTGFYRLPSDVVLDFIAKPRAASTPHWRCIDTVDGTSVNSVRFLVAPLIISHPSWFTVNSDRCSQQRMTRSIGDTWLITIATVKRFQMNPIPSDGDRLGQWVRFPAASSFFPSWNSV